MVFQNRIAHWKEIFARDMGVLNRTPRERLSFATIIIDAVVVDISSAPAPHVLNLIAKFEADWQRSLMKSGHLKRGTRYHGNIEIDLLHPKLLGGTNKQRLLAEFGIDVARLKQDQRILLIHYHAVVDAKGHQDGYRNAVAAAFPGHRRVVIQSLYETGTVAENLAILSGYMTKMRLRYSEAYEGKTTKFYVDYEPEWREWFRNFISDLLPSLTISSVVSRAAAGKNSASPECPIPETVTATNTKETEGFGTLLSTSSARAVENDLDDRNLYDEDISNTIREDDRDNESISNTPVEDDVQPVSTDLKVELSPKAKGILARLRAQIEPEPRTSGGLSPNEVLDRIRAELAANRQSTGCNDAHALAHNDCEWAVELSQIPRSKAPRRR